MYLEITKQKIITFSFAFLKSISTFENNIEESAEIEVHDAQNNGVYPLGSQFLTFLHSNLVTSAWYATKIVEPYGHEINFTYDRFSYTYYKLSDNAADGTCPSTVTKKINKVYVRGAEIASISGSNVKIVFNSGVKTCDDNTGDCTFITVPRYDVDS